MKRILTSIILSLILFLNPIDAFALIRNVQDNHRFVFTYEDASGDPITGETITLRIMRASDGYYFDFNDSTFKNSGWTNKTTNLSEDSTSGQEHYYYAFDPPASETGADQYIFIIDDADADNGLHLSETVSYQDLGTSDFDYSSNNVTVGDFASGVIDDDALGSISELPVATDYTSARAGYLDKLNVSGTLAHSDSASTYKATGFSTHSASDIWSVATRSLTILDEDSTTIDLDGSDVGGLTTWSKTGYSLSASGIDAIWDETITGHSTADSFGKVFDDQIDGLRAYGDSNWATGGSSTLTAQQVWEYATRTLTAGTKDAEIDAILLDTGTTIPATITTLQADLDNPTQYKATGFSTHSASDIWSVVSRTLTELDEDNTTIDLDSTEVSASASLSDADMNSIADKVWDETLADHVSSGSTGNKLNLSPTPYDVGP